VLVLIFIYENEDKNTIGSVKFVNFVSDYGNNMTGNWYRYSDNCAFTWNLEK
jgi:hypothetical protein